MVDFKNDTLMSKPPADIVALILLEKYANFLEALEVYITKESGNFTHNAFLSLKARLFSLYYCQKEAFARALKKDDLEKLDSIPDLEEFEEIIEAYDIITKWLDQTRILKLDTLKSRDLEDINENNKRSGYD